GASGRQRRVRRSGRPRTTRARFADQTWFRRCMLGRPSRYKMCFISTSTSRISSRLRARKRSQRGKRLQTLFGGQKILVDRGQLDRQRRIEQIKDTFSCLHALPEWAWRRE